MTSAQPTDWVQEAAPARKRSNFAPATTGQAQQRGRRGLGTVARYGLIALLGGLYLLPFMRVLSGAPDEGIYLYAADRVVHGAIPGRDFVQENPPGAYYWLAWFFRAFGTNLLTARTVLFFTAVATVITIFHLARRAGSSGTYAALFVLITSVPLMPINSPHYDSNLFALIAFAFFLRGCEFGDSGKQLYWPFAIAGVLAGWVSCILQQKGLLFLAAFSITALLLHRKRGIRLCMVMAACYASVILAEIAPYIVWGALPDLFTSVVKMPLTSYQGLNQVPYGFPIWTVWFPALYSQFRANAPVWIALPLLAEVSLPFIFMLIAPALVAVLGYLWRPGAFGKKLLPFWIAGYAMWLSELHRQDLSHLRNGCLLLAILFFALCERFGRRAPKRAALALTLGTLLMGTTSLNGALHAHQPIFSRRGTLVAHERYPLLDELIACTRPGDYAFVYPYSPVYYFLAEVRNPTRFSVIVDQHKGNPNMTEAVHDLEAHKPQYVIVDTTLQGDGMRTMFPAYRAPKPEDRVIDIYISSHYHLIRTQDGFELLERNGQHS